MALLLGIFRVDLISNDRYTLCVFLDHFLFDYTRCPFRLAFVLVSFRLEVVVSGLDTHDTLACPLVYDSIRVNVAVNRCIIIAPLMLDLCIDVELCQC